MSGLKTQCSIQQGRVIGGLRQSPMSGSALQGNMLTASVIYSNSTLIKRHNGISNNIFTDGCSNASQADCDAVFGTPYATPYDFFVVRDIKYSQQVDHFNDNEGNTYNGVMTAVNNIPYSSGYPAFLSESIVGYVSYIIPSGSHAYFNNDVGSNIVPGDLGAMVTNWTNTTTTYYNGQHTDPFTPTHAKALKLYNLDPALYPNNYAFREFTSDVSGEIDFSSYYTTAKADFLAITWNSGSSAFSCHYNEPFGFGIDLTSFDYVGNDLSFHTSNVAGFPSAPFGIGAVNGWMNSGAGISMCRGLAFNSSGVDQAYWIGHKRVTAGGDSFFSGIRTVPSGVTFTVSQTDFVSAGIIRPNGIIGIGQEIDLPFPTTNPFPYINLGNTIVTQDYYFVIIGQNIRGLGTITGVTT